MKIFLTVVLSVFVGGGQCMEQWEQDALAMSNDFRSRHNAAPLSYNPELASGAQEWADHLALNCMREEHSDRSGRGEPGGQSIGENIGQGSFMHVHKGKIRFHPGRRKRSTNNLQFAKDNYKMLINAWYGEHDGYDWQNGGGGGHFSQLVWKDTTQVGYALGVDENCDKWYLVGRFWPTGNIQGAYKRNVEPSAADM